MSAISEEELQEIVEVVCMTMLELPTELSDAVQLANNECMSSQIAISGAWQGVVTVQASVPFLTYAASVMFNCSVDDVTDLDRSDTLAELTNMLGGTVKCLLPETCDLSLPAVVDGEEVDKMDACWINLCCAGQPLAVAVCENAIIAPNTASNAA